MKKQTEFTVMENAVKTVLPRTTVVDDYYLGDNFRLTLPTRMASGE